MPCPPLPTTVPGSLKLLFLFQLQPGGQSGKERDPLLLYLLRDPGVPSSLGRREPETQRQSPRACVQSPAHSAHCSGEGLALEHKSSTNPFTLSASLCERDRASLAGFRQLQLQMQTQREVLGQGCVKMAPSSAPTHHTGQTCLEKL